MKLFGNSKKKKKNELELTPGKTGAERTPEEKKKIDELIAQYQRKKRRRRILLASILLAVLASLFAAYKLTVKPPKIAAPPAQNTKKPEGVSAPVETDLPQIEETNRKDGFYTFIIVGKDDGNGNTDTMILGAFDAQNKKLNLVHIPRDTMVNVPWSVKKVNTLMAFSEDEIEGLKSGIRDLIGFTVDSYMVVDLDAFVQLVNVVDGVDFDVPIDMHYEDPTQDLSIHISAGSQHLTGEEALKVFRFRSGYASADIGRIETQQNLLKALAQKMLRIGNVTKVDEFAKIFSQNVETDLTLGNIIWYGEQFLGMKEEDIVFHTLPEYYNDSVRGLSYCSIYVDEWLTLVNAFLNPYKEDITVEHVNILTRDENGNLTATSGEIRGGIDSFYNNEGGHADVDPTPEVSPPPTQSDDPEVTESPVQSGETQLPENTQSPEVSESPESSELPENSESPEGETPDITDPGETTSPTENSEDPANTEPPEETQPASGETAVPTDEPILDT
jgi:LCP family protein required for cell wall assembly